MAQLPINPVISGLLNGVAIASQIRNLAMQQDEASRRKRQFDEDRVDKARLREMQDVDLTSKLLDAGRPVHGDVVLGEDAVEDMLPSGVPGSAAAPQLGIVRPADKKRVVKYKRADGETVAVELYSEDERRKRRLTDVAAEEATKTRASVERARAMIAPTVEGQTALMNIPVNVPGMDAPVAKGALPSFTQMMRDRAANARTAATMANTNAQKAADRKSRETIASKRASRSSGELSAAGQATQNRFEITAKKQVEEKIGKLDAEIQAAWEKAQELEAIGGMKDGEEFVLPGGGQPKGAVMSPILRKHYGALKAKAKSQAKLATAARERLARQIGWGVGGESQGAASPGAKRKPLASYFGQ